MQNHRWFLLDPWRKRVSCDWPRVGADDRVLLGGGLSLNDDGFVVGSSADANEVRLSEEPATTNGEPNFVLPELGRVLVFPEIDNGRFLRCTRPEDRNRLVLYVGTLYVDRAPPQSLVQDVFTGKFMAVGSMLDFKPDTVEIHESIMDTVPVGADVVEIATKSARQGNSLSPDGLFTLYPAGLCASGSTFFDFENDRLIIIIGQSLSSTHLLEMQAITQDDPEVEATIELLDLPFADARALLSRCLWSRAGYSVIVSGSAENVAL